MPKTSGPVPEYMPDITIPEPTEEQLTDAIWFDVGIAPFPTLNSGVEDLHILEIDRIDHRTIKFTLRDDQDEPVVFILTVTKAKSIYAPVT